MSGTRGTATSTKYVPIPVSVEVYRHTDTTRHTIRIELVKELSHVGFAAMLGSLPKAYKGGQFTLSRDGLVIVAELTPRHPGQRMNKVACKLGGFFGRQLGFTDFWLTRLNGALEHKVIH